MSAAIALEHELQVLNEQITRTRKDANAKKADADALVASYRARGINPMTNRDAFEAVDRAYKESDRLYEQVEQMRDRAARGLHTAGRIDDIATAFATFGNRMATRLMGNPEFTGFANGSAKAMRGIEVLSQAELLQAFGMYAASTDITAAPVRDQQEFAVPIPLRPTRILDLVTIAPTAADTITYWEETTRTDVAAETALGTAYGEDAYVWTERTVNVRDIGSFTPAARSNLNDSGQVRVLITGRVLSTAQRRLEGQIVAGDATGVNLKGILNTAGIATVAKNGAEPRTETLHRCITQIRLLLQDEPDGIVLHPTDYESVMFEKDAKGDYLLDGVERSTSTLWGKPLIPSLSITQGTGLVGGFKQGAAVWLRSGLSVGAQSGPIKSMNVGGKEVPVGVQLGGPSFDVRSGTTGGGEVRVSESHSTFFTERRIAVLGEIRAAFAAWQPKAFVKATGL